MSRSASHLHRVDANYCYFNRKMSILHGIGKNHTRMSYVFLHSYNLRSIILPNSQILARVSQTDEIGGMIRCPVG